MIPCPKCGSTSIRRLYDSATGACENEYGCLARRCETRKKDDHKRFIGRRWTQCFASTGKRTTLFCELGEGHEGLHMHGTKEWSGKHSAQIAHVLKVLSTP